MACMLTLNGKKMTKFLLWSFFLLRSILGAPIILTDVVGKISSTINSPNDSFEWILQPNVNLDYVLFVFNSITINTAQLTIYDVSIESPLFSCAACGQLLPPVFSSKTGSISIKFQGVAGTSFTPSSFSVQYVGQISTGEVFESQYFNFKLNLFMGYGQLQPPLVGGNILPKSANMSWLIRVNAPTITFSIAKFNFPSNSQTTVTIYDGSTTLQPVLFGGSSTNQIPDYWLSTSSSYALIVLYNPEKDESIQLQIDYIADMELYRCGSLGIPDTLISNSMKITDGSKSTNNLRRGANCEWLITPIQRGPINLLFRWVSLKPGAKVVVYDSEDTTGDVLWNSLGTFTIVPPPIISTGSSLYVTYTSNTLLASSFLGFQGDYYSSYRLSPGVGTKQEFYSMSSTLGIKLPDRLSSITQPKYSPGFDYSYLIQPQSSTSPLILFFNKLAFPDCGDYLEIYDGKIVDSNKLLGIFCSSITPYKWIYAPSGQMLIRFIANSDQSRNATFDLSYYSDGPNYHCGFTTNPAIIRATSMIITDGSQSSESIYSNQYCEWIISPFGDNFGIFLYFDRLNIEGGGVLTIYDGTDVDAKILIHMSEVNVVPVPVYSQQSTDIRIVYSTSSSIGRGTGFSFSYFSFNPLHIGPGDDVIKIYSSSYSSLTLPRNVHTKQFISSNYTWHINPANSSDSIYLIFPYAHITSCLEFIYVHDGSPTHNGSSLVEFSCLNQISSNYQAGSWIKVLTGEMVVQFITKRPFSTTSLTTTESDFSLAYFTKEGKSFQCGIAKNPLQLTLSSYFISDGTKSNEKMTVGDICEWMIEILENNILVFEMLSVDLRGDGQLWIFDGPNENSALLWSCLSCFHNPPLLLSSSNVLFIRYISPTINSNQMGTGFQGVYWSLANDPNSLSDSNSLLLLPTDFSFSSHVPLHINETNSWNLLLKEETTTLIQYPFYQLASSSSSSSGQSLDGRDSNLMKEMYRQNSQQSTCGIIHGQANFQSSNSYLTSSQSSTRYISYRNTSDKKISSIFGSWIQSVDSNTLSPSSTCVYVLDSGSNIQSITVTVEEFISPSTGHLRIYGGITGTDHLLVDLVKTKSSKPLKIQLPCGKGLIILDSNVTMNSSNLVVNYGFQISYSLNKNDYGKACKKYIRSLKKVEKKSNFLQKLLIPLFILALTMVIILICLFIQNKLPKLSYFFPSFSLFWPTTTKKKSKRGRPQLTPSPYPPYTPQIDHIRNQFLFHGDCMVCHLDNQKVLTLSCSHKICLEDLNGYIVAALGNVSMFPLKCPLYFNNCPGKILPKEAKRVLTKVQYEKFCEFCDRSEFGEGIRCIFCNYYVNYPSNINISMVECPHCLQRCCIKCKKPWHYGQKCPLEILDDSLDLWTKQTGAQKCLICLKVIEKDDPDTCHHMVHKSTDGIPCIRDRTDFCYLCGLEVAPEYPHDEIINPGMNHFPDGVFQNCRTILVRERDIEREKIRKMKRMKKSQNVLRSKSNVSMIVPVETDNDWEAGTIRGTKSAPILSTDPFDLAWSQTLNGTSPLQQHSQHLQIQQVHDLLNELENEEDGYDDGDGYDD